MRSRRMVWRFCQRSEMKLRRKVLVGSAAGDAGDAEAPDRADDRESDENEASPDVLAGEDFKQPAAADGAATMARKRAEFDDAITPGKFFSGSNSGNKPYFTGPKNALLGAPSETRPATTGAVDFRRGEQSQRHDADLAEFDADGDGAFAETVGEVAAGHREDDEWQGEQCATTDMRNARDASLCQGKRHVHDEEHGEGAIDVVAERALELHRRRATRNLFGAEGWEREAGVA